MHNYINLFFSLIEKNQTGAPDPDHIGFSNPTVISIVILLIISLMLPCIIWFIRNFIRIVLKKNYDLFNRSIKWIVLCCLIVFILTIILLVLAVKGII